MLGSVPNSANMLGRYLLNSANKLRSGILAKSDNGYVDSIGLRSRLIEMTDKNEYVSARTRSKARLETNKAIMTKAHEEGGDLTSSERLASAFLLLGIAETSGDVAEI